MLKLYGHAKSRAVRVLWLLHELGIEFGHIDCLPRSAETKTPGFLAMNSAGMVPIIDDDGFILAESMAIISIWRKSTTVRFIHQTPRTKPLPCNGAFGRQTVSTGKPSITRVIQPILPRLSAIRKLQKPRGRTACTGSASSKTNSRNRIGWLVLTSPSPTSTLPARCSARWCLTYPNGRRQTRGSIVAGIALPHRKPKPCEADRSRPTQRAEASPQAAFSRPLHHPNTGQSQQRGTASVDRESRENRKQ